MAERQNRRYCSLKREAGDDSSAEGSRLLAPKKKILVIDDDATLRRALSRLLSQDFEVVAVDSGKAALAALHSRNMFDAVLCDLNMPGMNGIDVVAAIAAVDRTLAARVIIMTGGSEGSELDARLRLLPNARIEKPFPPGAVVEMLRSRLA